ncbi:PLP-dependent cysteine synthase family protein [Eubacterium multiforme]|uniref:Cysteine synthase A n=1 Tax=Eubacterium multiforme TaxID=83339 RepID=A0ABT9UNM5_9FIRM|nr:PLP-dependent cysteine synthase family protein [Eubacterium multiforme]MDQ0148241.1 cysteine synthase A [Eubacterium multiforme]
MNLIKNKFESLEKLIGNTPLLEISFTYKGQALKIYSKLEYYNFSGSIKDRMALYILKNAYNQNKIKPNDRIIETTSGNTGISFASIGSYLNHPVSIYMPDFMSMERISLIKSFGADIHLVSKKDGGFLKCIELAKKAKSENSNVFLPSQFSNTDNIMAHYLSTGPEIWSTLVNNGLIPSAFIAGVGTGGTIMGVSRYLKKMYRKITVHPLEPENSKTLSFGYDGSSHRIEGISDEFVPEILKLYELDNIVNVNDGDAIIMAQKLSKELGLGVGISSGANFIGALKILLSKKDADSTVVTVFPDDNKKYLTTDLMKKEPIKNAYLSKDINLLSIKTL